MEQASAKTHQLRKPLNSLPSNHGAGRAVGANEENPRFASAPGVTRTMKGRRIVKNQTQQTVSLGELILAVFDNAAQFSLDPREVSRLATETVAHMLWRGGNFAGAQAS
jgi:hypothetical protein